MNPYTQEIIEFLNNCLIASTIIIIIISIIVGVNVHLTHLNPYVVCIKECSNTYYRQLETSMQCMNNCNIAVKDIAEKGLAVLNETIQKLGELEK